MKRLFYQFTMYFFVFTWFANLANAQVKFEEKEAFLSFLKTQPDLVPTHFMECVYRFEKDKYNFYLDDEFEKQKKIKAIDKLVKGLDATKTYYIEYTAEFGTYNFVSKSFNFVPFTEEQHVEIVPFLFSSRAETNTSIALAFTNGTEITNLPMSEEQANYLVKMKKNPKNGKIDRRAFIKIIFQTDGLSEMDEASSVRNKVILKANILEIEVFENANYEIDPLVVLSTNLKRERDEAAKKAEQAKK